MFSIFSQICDEKDNKAGLTISSGAPSLDKAFPITNVNWQVTDKCNLACPYCYSEEKYANSASHEIGKKVVDWLINIASQDRENVNLNFFGGEPLIRWKLIKSLILYAEGQAIKAGKRISFGMVTNGTLLTEDVIKTLIKHRFNITVSIDGSPEIHDMNRKYKSGRGSWKTLKRNLKFIISYFPQISVRMTISPQNIDRLSEGFFYIYDELGIKHISAHPVWEYEWIKESLEIYDREIGLLAKNFCDRFEAGEIVTYDVFNRSIREILKGKRKDYPCGVAKGFVGIDPLGNIYSCHRFITYSRIDPAFQMGTVYNNNLTANRGPFNTYSLDKLHGCEGVNCKECEVKILCSGGCPAVFYYVNGNIYSPPPSYRPLLLIFKKHADYIIQYFHKKPNKKFEIWSRKLMG